MNIRPESASFVLYVDEAGDDGLRSFKPEDPKGCTEWLCLAGYLVRAEIDKTLPDVHLSLRQAVGSRQSDVIHYRNLSDPKRLVACEHLAKTPARAFAVCSYKRTLQNYHNPRVVAANGGSSQFLYNWLIRMLLERVTDFVVRDASYERNKDYLRVVFSHRGGHRFGQMKAYVEQLKAQAVGNSTWIKTREIRPEVLRFQHFESVPYYQMAGLQLADIVASAVYQGLDTHAPRWTCNPAKALSRLVAREVVSGRRLTADYGLTLVPQPHKVALRHDQRQLFEAYGYVFDEGHAFR
ncbi:DUF3800 domain-containing protein [Cypionkella psychrotolerans]|uniref:DUF3800 domain-containing protein n=1 Tax=Cypionkella psychrotolerans TaxID=1678131 RepID=UPI0009EA87C9|nr:DUF3800 domain-containing protein [Cypionkella psychrotolerans]